MSIDISPVGVKEGKTVEGELDIAQDIVPVSIPVLPETLEVNTVSDETADDQNDFPEPKPEDLEVEPEDLEIKEDK